MSDRDYENGDYWHRACRDCQHEFSGPKREFLCAICRPVRDSKQPAPLAATHSEDGRDICAAGDLRGEFLGCSFSQYRMERGIKLSLDDGVLSILLTDDQPARQVGGGDRSAKAILEVVARYAPGAGLPAPLHQAALDANDWLKSDAALAPAAVAAVLPEPYGWIAAGEFFRLRQYAIDAAEKTPCIEVYSRQQMLGLNRRAIPVGLVERVLKVMEDDWYQIDGEWGPYPGGLDKAISDGAAEEIRELRALLGKEGE